jgi:hypothetical protein
VSTKKKAAAEPTLREFAELLAEQAAKKLAAVTKWKRSNALTLACREWDTARAMLDLPASDPSHALAPAHAVGALVEASFYYGVALCEEYGSAQISRQNRRNAKPDPTRGKAAAKVAIMAEWDAVPAELKSKRGIGANFDRAMHEKHRCVEPNSVKKWREEYARAGK